MIRRVAVVLGLLTAVGVATGAAAVLPITESAPLQVFDVDSPSPTAAPTTTLPDEPDDGNESDDKKVWVCVVLVRKDGTLTLKPGKNPLHVSVHARDAQDGASPDHPSYVVDNGSVSCRVDGEQIATGS